MSRSSTRTPIRDASPSIRPITMSVSGAAPWRYNSANPRIVVSGVRNSCEASATKRRIFSSERRADSSDASVAANACSIWVSMLFSAIDR